MNLLLAYSALFLAGVACACVGQGIADGFANTPFVYLPAGLAAVGAGIALRKPFMRAVLGRRRVPLYAWLLLGVLLAHVLYGLLIAVFLLKSAGFVASFQTGVIMGAFSVYYGLLINILLGVAFTEVVLSVAAPSRQIGVDG